MNHRGKHYLNFITLTGNRLQYIYAAFDQKLNKFKAMFVKPILKNKLQHKIKLCTNCVI